MSATTSYTLPAPCCHSCECKEKPCTEQRLGPCYQAIQELKNADTQTPLKEKS